jgi:hypothetical protein
VKISQRGGNQCHTYTSGETDYGLHEPDVFLYRLPSKAG